MSDPHDELSALRKLHAEVVRERDTAQAHLAQAKAREELLQREIEELKSDLARRDALLEAGRKS